MISYIVQIVLFQVLFLAVYDFFLQKETFFKWNRFYLLITPILSLIIPLLKFESFQKAIPQEYVVLLPEVVLNPQVIIEQTSNSAQILNYLSILFYVGTAIVTILFLIKLLKIIRLIFSNTIIKKENYKLILLKNKQSAFSFFNYIFINKSLIEKEELQVIQHELVHSKQYHTLDLLFFELFKIIMWFNPMVYIYQKRITLLHEYISDAEVVKEINKNTYFNNLLATTFNVENISFINQFYKHSLIKKRIIMITKNKSQKIKQLKYLLLIPVLASMLFYTSCTNEVQRKEKQTIEKIEIEQSKDSENVSFAIIDKSPTFPKCTGNNETLKDCLNKSIKKHVQLNFNSNLPKSLGLTGNQKIYVQFKITKIGDIEIIKAKSSHKDLENEARRVVNSLPKMIPGEHNGKKVNVTYMLPISFEVKE